MLQHRQEEPTTTPSAAAHADPGQQLLAGQTRDLAARRIREAQWAHRSRLAWKVKDLLADVSYLIAVTGLLAVIGCCIAESLRSDFPEFPQALTVGTLVVFLLGGVSSYYLKFTSIGEHQLDIYLRQLARRAHVAEDVVRRPSPATPNSTA